MPLATAFTLSVPCVPMAQAKVLTPNLTSIPIVAMPPNTWRKTSIACAACWASPLLTSLCPTKHTKQPCDRWAASCFRCRRTCAKWFWKALTHSLPTCLAFVLACLRPTASPSFSTMPNIAPRLPYMQDGAER